MHKKYYGVYIKVINGTVPIAYFETMEEAKAWCHAPAEIEFTFQISKEPIFEVQGSAGPDETKSVLPN